MENKEINRKYRKTKIPRNKTPLKKDLMKKHNIHYEYCNINLSYPKDSKISEEIVKASKDLGLTKTGLAKQALIYYLQFIKPSFSKK